MTKLLPVLVLLAAMLPACVKESQCGLGPGDCPPEPSRDAGAD